MSEERSLGCLPSPMDRRDYPTIAFYPIATSHSNDYQPKELIKAEFQGGVGACVAFGQELQTAYHEFKERGTLERFDQNYIYRNRLLEHHQGEGMHPRQAYSMLRVWGVPPKGLFPFTTPRPYSILKDIPLTPEMNSKAVHQRIRSYFQVGNNETEVKTALEHGPVGITIPVYQSFNDCPNSGILRLPNTASETLLGYHFIVIIGWKRINNITYWVIQNSWRRWGDSKMWDYSMGYMPTNYPITELWGVIDEDLPPFKKKDITIEMWIDNSIAKVDGVDHQIDKDDPKVTPIIIGRRTRLPIRFIGEAFDCRVDWDASERKVTITK